jgi:hypothetical protein
MPKRQDGGGGGAEAPAHDDGGYEPDEHV